jgi:hypothetical protein
LLPVMVGMGSWTLSQEDMKAPETEFLRALSGPESQAMREYIDRLRITHAVN